MDKKGNMTPREKELWKELDELKLIKDKEKVREMRKEIWRKLKKEDPDYAIMQFIIACFIRLLQLIAVGSAFWFGFKYL